jgi:hypothetical protein
MIFKISILLIFGSGALSGLLQLLRGVGIILVFIVVVGAFSGDGFTLTFR